MPEPQTKPNRDEGGDLDLQHSMLAKPSSDTLPRGFSKPVKHQSDSSDLVC